MSEASSVLSLLEELERLMRLNDENPFKVRAFEKARSVLQGRDDLEARARDGTLTEIPGIGKGIEQVLTDFILHGKAPLKAELEAKLPPGLLELTQVPGLGPKKARSIIEALGLQSLAELEYACRENRLVGLKGFGEKAQAQILSALETMKAYQGRALWAELEPKAEALLERLRPEAERLEFTGEYRRRLEVVSALEFLAIPKKEDPQGSALQEALRAELARSPLGVEGRVRMSSAGRFGSDWFETTAAEAHKAAAGAGAPVFKEEESLYRERLSVEWIPPELRETEASIEFARSGKLKELPETRSIQGIFHCHTTRSDGSASLEEMVIRAKRLGYRYLGVSDHSQSAFYANGLKPDALREQEREIRTVREKHPEIRVFFGIESDILQDGALDYEPALLKRFDFVIASIHSRFKMDREAMTRRIVAAIENPATRFVGHLTGRILLGRPGYDLDFERVFKAAEKHSVAIEINAHPSRLDVDWRHGASLREIGNWVSINPDAHEPDGLSDVRFGVNVARKALLPKSRIVNTFGVKEIEAWLKR